MMINPYSIPVFSSSLVLVLFGIFVIRKNVKSHLNIAFLLICISCSVWLFFYSIAFSTTNMKLIMILFRIGYCGISFIPVTVLFYTTVFANYSKKINYISCFLGLMCSYFILTSNFIISNAKEYYWGYYPFAGKFHPLFLVFFSVPALLSFLILIKCIFVNNNNSIKLNQAKYVSLAFIIFAFASFDFIPNYGIELYPFGYVPTIIFLAIVACAIVKHHLMDINIVIRKGLVYSILITLFTIMYLTIVMSVEHIFQGIIGYRSLLISILFASIIALLFIPLKNRIQSLIDKVFLGKTPEQIAQENELLRHELLRSEKLKTVATFASGMAHEIKNPLTAIKTFTEYLPQKIGDKEFLEKFSKIVGSEVEKIDDLVHQLLDYSKPAPLQLKETDIHKLIDDTLELLNNQFIRNNIKIDKNYSLDAARSTLRVDPNQMKQAFLNLFLNAIEAMFSGGTIRISTNPSSSSGRESMIICVQDTGCGIPKKNIPQIFEPFYSSKEKGSGLGLSIVYNIINEHKGYIKVESMINKGTNFIIKLPT
ncbi:ATP-binding protein [Candidatus Omnitrophota bacterium]